MGNTVTCVTPAAAGGGAAGAGTGAGTGAGAGGNGGGARKVRVLLPEGEIALLDGPLDAADLMMEHLNHMVVHCSTEGAHASTGKRTTMTIMQPHEKLEPGQSYVVHPIPSQFKKTSKFLKPQPFSISNSNMSMSSVREEGDNAQELQADPRKKSARLTTTHRFKKRVADSGDAGDAAQTTELKSNAKEPSQDREAHAQDQGEDDDDDDPIVLNLNMHMGWRPALESIPESPIGSSNHLDQLIQGPSTVLCA